MKPRWLVYMLVCRDGSLYTGITNDLDRRLAAHAAGKASRYTRSKLPVQLAYRELQPTRSAALKREAVLKKLPRRDKLRLATTKPPHPAASPPRGGLPGFGSGSGRGSRRPRGIARKSLGQRA